MDYGVARRRASSSEVGLAVARPSSSPRTPADEPVGRRFAALVAIMIMMLMATSSAFARKASHYHSKRAGPNHHSTTKTDPGGVARDPADVELDRKIGSICRGC
jgi:hypothetical protein